MQDNARRARLSIDVDPGLRRKIRVAAAERDVSVRDLVVAILQQALEASDASERRSWSALSVRSFARDWDSDADSVYDALG